VNSVKVLCIWKARPELRSYLLENMPFAELVFPDDVSDENIIKLAVDADVTIGWRPTKEILMAAEKVKVHINPGAGVQHVIDLFRECREAGHPIPLVNGHGNAYFTAQNTVALLLGYMDGIVQHHNWMLEGRWRFGDDELKSIPLQKRKVGLLGYGHVNRNVHRMLSGFDLEFSILRREWSKQNGELPTKAKRYSPDQLDEFIKSVDVLIVALPSTQKTIGLIGSKQLDLLGPDGILVHVGRGKVIEEEALYNALKEKRIRGAAIDVWYEYRPEPDEEGRKRPYNFPFHELDNIVLSPHRSASPLDDLERWDEVVENVKRVAEGRTDYLNLVDLDEEY